MNKETLSNLPSILKDQTIFIPFKIAKDPKKKDHLTKVSYEKWNEPQNLMTFDEANDLVEAGQKGYNAIGIVIPTGIYGIDIDHCIDPKSGELNEVAKDVLAKVNSYTEVSISGTGLHILAISHFDQGIPAPKANGVEMYQGDYKRPFVCTGDVYKGKNKIQDQDKQIKELYEYELKRNETIDMNQKDNNKTVNQAIDPKKNNTKTVDQVPFLDQKAKDIEPLKGVFNPKCVEAHKTYLKKYLENNGLLEKAPKSGYICPFCGSGTGNNGTGAFSIKDGTFYNCFSCHRHGDIYNLIEDLEQVSPTEAFLKVCAYTHIYPEQSNSKPVQSHTSPYTNDLAKDEQYTMRGENNVLEAKETGSFNETADHEKQKQKVNDLLRESLLGLDDSKAIEYLNKRGINKDTALKYNLGYLKDQQGMKDCISIYVNDETMIFRNMDQQGEPRYKNLSGSTTKEFNLSALDQAKIIFLVEGTFDALSILQANDPRFDVVALNSTANGNDFIRILEERKKHDKAIPQIILALDNDEAGKKASNELAQKLNELGVINSVQNISGQYKDANEALQHDPEELKKNLDQAYSKHITSIDQAYRGDLLINSMIEMIKESKGLKPIPTGFQSLDKELDGGLFSGLYMLIGGTSTGKTTFTTSIVDHIAKSGRPVIYVSLEMANYELIANSISRKTYYLSNDKDHRFDSSLAKTSREILRGDKYETYSKEDKEIIYEAMQNYKEYGKNIYIYEGHNDIDVDKVEMIVKQFVQTHDQTPIIVIDYFQLLQPSQTSITNRSTDKQIADYNITALKVLSRKYKTTVFCIGSIPRSEYNNTVSIGSNKESGNIEYSVDVQLGLQLEKLESIDKKLTQSDINSMIDQETAKDERDILITVNKNRFGKRGSHLKFTYKAKYNVYEDKGVKETETTSKTLKV